MRGKSELRGHLQILVNPNEKAKYGDFPCLVYLTHKNANPIRISLNRIYL